MAKKKDTNPITSQQVWEMTGLNKCIIEPQKVAPTNFENPKDN